MLAPADDRARRAAAGPGGGASPAAGGTVLRELLPTSSAASSTCSTRRTGRAGGRDAAQSSDLAGATVAVEKASIAIDLVAAIRNKAVDAYQDVMRMQV